jgi:hypothetical protein
MEAKVRTLVERMGMKCDLVISCICDNGIGVRKVSLFAVVDTSRVVEFREDPSSPTDLRIAETNSLRWI